MDCSFSTQKVKYFHILLIWYNRELKHIPNVFKSMHLFFIYQTNPISVIYLQNKPGHVPNFLNKVLLEQCLAAHFHIICVCILVKIAVN